MAAIDPGPERPDDYTGPPVTAAEIATLEKLVMVLGGLAVEAGESALAADAREENGTRAGGVAEQASRGRAGSPEAAGKSFDQLSRRAERLTRAVRVTLAQKARLVMALQRWRERNARSAEKAETRRSKAARERQQAQAANVSAIVEEIVGHDGGAAAAIGVRRPVERWFAERDYAAHLAKLSVGEMVARICRDIGQDVNWRDWQGRPWAADAEAFFGRAAAVQAAEPDREDANPAGTAAAAASDETTAEQAAPVEAPASEPAAHSMDGAGDPRRGDPQRGDAGPGAPADPAPPDPVSKTVNEPPMERWPYNAVHRRRCPVTGQWQFLDPLTQTWK